SSTVVTLTEPSALVASNTHGSIACNGGSTTVRVSGTGGSGPYSGTGGLPPSAGTTTYTVTDSHNCISSTVVTLTEPSALVASNTHGSLACNGGSTTVSVSATGVTGPYSGTGDFTQSAGTTTHSLHDALPIFSSTVVTLTEPSALVASNTHGSIACNGGSTTV